MNIFEKDGSTSRDMVPAGGVNEMDREAMRGWVQTLRREAAALRQQADHMRTVAQDAESLADRIEHVLRTV